MYAGQSPGLTPSYDPIAVNDVDASFAFDCTLAMGARSDTLADVTVASTSFLGCPGSAPVSPPTGGFEVSAPAIEPGNFVFGFTVTAGTVAGQYEVIFALTTVRGSTLNRSVLIEVVPTIA